MVDGSVKWWPYVKKMTTINVAVNLNFVFSCSLVLHSSQGLAWRARAGSFVLSILKMRRQPCLPASLLVLFKQRRVCSLPPATPRFLSSDDARIPHIFRRQHLANQLWTTSRVYRRAAALVAKCTNRRRWSCAAFDHEVYLLHR